MQQKNGVKTQADRLPNIIRTILDPKGRKMKFKKTAGMGLATIRKCASDDGSDVNSKYTADSLISSRTSSDVILNDKENIGKSYRKQKAKTIGVYVGLVSGILFIFWGIAMFIFTPFKLLLSERTRMLPGLPPYEWWLHPPDEVLLKVYLFNVTNSEKFLDGTDSKIKMEEVGPLIYREKLIHKNPIFNENSTLSYIANRSAIFLPELNSINLNSTIVVPNLAVLLMPSFLYDAPYFVKFGLNVMLRTYHAEPLVTTTIQNYLWNMTDPILVAAQALAPNLVPSKNTGILANVYSQFEDEINVFIGAKYGNQQFFQIDNFHGSPNLPSRDSNCKDKITNSTEGLAYPQMLTRNDTLKYWRKTLCKVAPLTYSNDEHMYGVEAYRYSLLPELYDRTQPSNKDCYKGMPSLPSGLSDVSACYYGLPFAVSYPHFLYASEEVQGYVEGLNPDKEKHGSYVITEPITGIPLEGKAKSQMNLIMRKLSGFNNKIQKFSNIAIPLAWLEYHQVGIPWYIHALVYFTARVVPIGQYFFAAFLIVLGLGLAYRSMKKKKKSGRHLMENKLINFETEKFLKAKN